jgi:hypothetical protein
MGETLDNSDINAVTLEIRLTSFDNRDAYFDFGVKRGETTKPGHQPPGRKRAWSRDGQHTNSKPAADPVSSEEDTVEAGARSFEQQAALGGELNTGVEPGK